jgi:hypothetical protein
LFGALGISLGIPASPLGDVALLGLRLDRDVPVRVEQRHTGR